MPMVSVSQNNFVWIEREREREGKNKKKTVRVQINIFYLGGTLLFLRTQNLFSGFIWDFPFLYFCPFSLFVIFMQFLRICLANL